MLDSHAHFWDPGRLDYPWLDSVPALKRELGPREYRAEARGVAVASVLFVEANPRPDQGVAEAERIAGLASQFPWIEGIVAFADLTSPSLHATLDTLAGIPLLRGIRHNIQGQPSGFCLDPLFVEGVREVGRRGLVFDLCATHEQLGEVSDLVRRAPGTDFVLDHCGKPAIRDALLDPWRADIARLAGLRNVDCKISGLLTEAAPGAGLPELLPYLSHVVESFGRARVMYGSDWPVVDLAGGHEQWYETTESFVADWTESDKHGFYERNARRVYGIGHPRPAHTSFPHGGGA